MEDKRRKASAISGGIFLISLGFCWRRDGGGRAFSYTVGGLDLSLEEAVRIAKSPE
jgi:hypothetical protein